MYVKVVTVIYKYNTKYNFKQILIPAETPEIIWDFAGVVIQWILKCASHSGYFNFLGSPYINFSTIIHNINQGQSISNLFGTLKLSKFLGTPTTAE